jgi:hypothetical protein
MSDAAPPKPARPAVLLLGAVAVVAVLLFGFFLALFDVISGGAWASTNQHLDQLEEVLAATEPVSAVTVSHFRNDVCGSGVNEVGRTIRISTTLAALDDHYRRKLHALGWKVTTNRLSRRDPQGSLEAARRYDWGRAHFRVEPGRGGREIDVAAGFNCGIK